MKRDKVFSFGAVMMALLSILSVNFQMVTGLPEVQAEDVKFTAMAVTFPLLFLSALYLWKRPWRKEGP